MTDSQIPVPDLGIVHLEAGRDKLAKLCLSPLFVDLKPQRGLGNEAVAEGAAKRSNGGNGAGQPWVLRKSWSDEDMYAGRQYSAGLRRPLCMYVT
jgi:hypothetical protein